MIKYNGYEILDLDFDILNAINIETHCDCMPEQFEIENSNVCKQIVDFLETIGDSKIEDEESAKQTIETIEEKEMASINNVFRKYINRLKRMNKELDGTTHYNLSLKDAIDRDCKDKIIRDIIF